MAFYLKVFSQMSYLSSFTNYLFANLLSLIVLIHVVRFDVPWGSISLLNQLSIVTCLTTNSPAKLISRTLSFSLSTFISSVHRETL